MTHNWIVINIKHKSGGTFRACPEHLHNAHPRSTIGHKTMPFKLPHPTWIIVALKGIYIDNEYIRNSMVCKFKLSKLIDEIVLFNYLNADFWTRCAWQVKNKQQWWEEQYSDIVCPCFSAQNKVVRIYYVVTRCSLWDLNNHTIKFWHHILI